MHHGYPITFILTVLATWRITHLFVAEDGPYDLVVKLRARLGDSMAGKAMDCFYCLNLWVAAPLALVTDQSLGGWCLAWIALSGGACLLERVTAPKSV